MNALPSSFFFQISIRDDSAKWKNIKREIDSLKINNTFHPAQTIQILQILCIVKNDELDNPLRYKICLVAKGFSPEYLVDYADT